MKRLFALLLALTMVCSVTAAAEKTEATEAPTFNRANEAAWDVTVEIAAIMPYAGVYREGAVISSYKTNYTEAVCQCLTTEGEIAWLYIDIDDYNLFFDESASLGISGIASFSEMTYETPLMLHGICMETDSLARGLADAAGSDTIVWFSRVD